MLHVFRLQYVLARLVDAGILKECEQVCTLVFYTFQFIYTYIPWMMIEHMIINSREGWHEKVPLVFSRKCELSPIAREVFLFRDSFRYLHYKWNENDRFHPNTGSMIGPRSFFNIYKKCTASWKRLSLYDRKVNYV